MNDKSYQNHYMFLGQEKDQNMLEHFHLEHTSNHPHMNLSVCPKAGIVLGDDDLF